MWLFMGAASGSAHRRLRAVLPASIFLLVSALTAPQASFGVGNPAPPAPQVVPGQVVVGFDDAASGAQQRKAVNEAGGRIAERLDLIDGAVVESKDGQATADVASGLAGS